MGLLDRFRKPAESPNVQLSNFGTLTNGVEAEGVDFSATGAIEPREVERLRAGANGNGVGHMSIDLDGYIEGGVDIVAPKEDEEWLYEFWKMRKDDTVRDALNYMLSIFHTSPFYVEPASEEEADLDVAAFVADSLGLDGKRAGKYSFKRILKSYEHALIYRRSAGEIVFTQGDDGMVVMDKFIPLHPFNIEEIVRDSRGGPRAVQLRGVLLDENRRDVDRALPVYKTLIFVNDDEGDMVGESILESAWVPWKIKRAMLQLINAGFERFLLGIPVMTVPKGVRKGTKEWNEAKGTLTKFAMRPRTGLLVPEGYSFEIKVVNSQMPDALPYLRLMDEAIYKAMGMTFSTMGRGDNSSGTYTVGGALSEAAQRNVMRLLNQFLEYVNIYLIPKLVLVNYPDAVNFPTLKVPQNSVGDSSSVLNAYAQMVSASSGPAGFDEAQYQAIAQNAPSVVRELLGLDADRRRELVETRRRSVR